MSKTMSSRERVLCVLGGGKPDRPPFSLNLDRRMAPRLQEKWGPNFLLDHYGVDMMDRLIDLPWWRDAASERKIRYIDDGHTVWQMDPIADSIDDALTLDLPDPTSDTLLAGVNSLRDAHPDKAVFAFLLAPLDILWGLRRDEGLYFDIIDHPAKVHEFMRRVREVLIEAARRACALDIDMLYTGGDICGRNGPMVSPRHLREFLFDYMADVVDIAHKAGKKVFYHTDGYVLPIVDIFVEYGYDGINPLEHRYNDPEEFLAKAGGKLMLYGGLDNCKIIPDGTPQEVRDHVRQTFDILGKEGRLIMSSHDIPVHCPEENLEAMVDEIKACRYLP